MLNSHTTTRINPVSDAAYLRLARKGYEHDMKEAAYWRKIAIERFTAGYNVSRIIKRAKYFLTAAKEQRIKIQNNIY